MNDIELINYIQNNDKFSNDVHVGEHFITATANTEPFIYNFSRKQLQDVLVNVDKDFNVETHHRYFTFKFFRDSVTRETIEKELQDNLINQIKQTKNTHDK